MTDVGGPPPGQGWQGQQPWPPAPPPYGYQPQRTSGKAVAALVCSILNFIVCPLVLAIVGLVLAGQARREIEASQGAIGGDGLVTAARILSIIGLLMGAVAVLAVVAIVLVTLLGSSTSSSFSSVGSAIGSMISGLV